MLSHKKVCSFKFKAYVCTFQLTFAPHRKNIWQQNALFNEIAWGQSGLPFFNWRNTHSYPYQDIRQQKRCQREPGHCNWLSIVLITKWPAVHNVWWLECEMSLTFTDQLNEMWYIGFGKGRNCLVLKCPASSCELTKLSKLAILGLQFPFDEWNPRRRGKLWWVCCLLVQSSRHDALKRKLFF